MLVVLSIVKVVVRGCGYKWNLWSNIHFQLLSTCALVPLCSTTVSLSLFLSLSFSLSLSLSFLTPSSLPSPLCRFFDLKHPDHYKVYNLWVDLCFIFLQFTCMHHTTLFLCPTAHWVFTTHHLGLNNPITILQSNEGGNPYQSQFDESS